MILEKANLLRDYLGNITHQVNTSNAVVAEYNFDAWGRRRSADDWSYTLDANNLDLVADRGFTGHEFLKWFNVYNMNGRLYDPLVGRFMNSDLYIQAPGYTQSFNRYSYCLNNPLRFTDPSGYLMSAAGEYQNLGKANTYWADNHIPVWFGMDNTNGGADGGKNGYIDDFWNNILNRFEDIRNDPNSGDNTSIANRGRNKYGIEGVWAQTITITGNYHDWLRGSNSSNFQANVINTFTADKSQSGDNWLNTLNTGNTWVGTGAFATGKVLSDTRLGSNIGYQIAYNGIGNATKYLKPAGVGTSIVGAIVGVYKFVGTENKTWGVYGQLGISLLSSGLTLGGSTTPLGIGIGVIDVFGGFNGFYNYLDNQQQFYNNTGGILVPMNGIPYYFQLNRK